MKKKIKNQEPPGTSCSAVESLLIKKYKQVPVSLFSYHMLASIWYTGLNGR